MKVDQLSILSSWLWLVLLTVLSAFIGVVIDNYFLFITTVLFIVFLKGQQIVDVFMELGDAPTRWRWLLLSYVILLPLIIASIYLF